uniref:Facilitated trehalose transporter Tret1-like n=1 Tax=Diabrotica virgifera virgifera TaxID=50390 RepID=A0A6P7FVE6_DIAVI
MVTQTVTKIVGKSEETQTEKTWYQVVVVSTISLVSLNCGISFAWPSPFLIKLVNDKENYNISEEEGSYFSVISIVAVVILPVFLSLIVNQIGRKRLLLLTAFPYVTAYVLAAFSRNIWLFYLARLITGIGDCIAYTCLVVYIAEISSPQVRGTWGNAIVWSGFLGQFIINVLGLYCSVMVASLVCAVFPVIFLFIFVFMPESPYFYLNKGQDEEAKVSLRRLKRKNNVEEEFSRLKEVMEKELKESGSWSDLVTHKTNRRALFAAIFLRVSQIFSGIFTLGPYIQFIFLKSGTNISMELSTILFTFINFVLYSAASYGSNKLGRRVSLISSLLGTSIIFLLEAAYFFVDTFYLDINLKPIQWFPLVGLILFLVVSSYGIGTVPFLMPGELFAPNIKAQGISVVISAFGLSNLIMNTLFYSLNNVTGLGGPFLVFGLCNIISAVVVYKFIPETKNKTLEEIQIILSKM